MVCGVGLICGLYGWFGVDGCFDVFVGYLV